MKYLQVFSLVAILILTLSACGLVPETGADANSTDPMVEEPAVSQEMDAPMMEEETGEPEAMMDEESELGDSAIADDKMPGDDMMDDESMDGDSLGVDDMMDEDASGTMDENDPIMAEFPGWFQTGLTDVSSSESFSIQDYKGKVILVQTFAVWCSTCLRQQQEILALHEALGERDDFVSLSLDIDPNEHLADVKAHLEKHGFSWLYAVATTDMAREIGNLYGSQFLNPPSAPVLLIDRAGKVHILNFGLKSADQLKQSVEALLNEEM